MLQISKRKFKAFSYLEIIVVLAVLSIASAFVIPLTISELGSTRIGYFANDIVTLSFAVQQDAYSQIGGSAHGIRFNTTSYDVFEGDSYATATSTFTIDMNNSVEITDVSLTDVATSNPTSELVFDRGDFRPSSYGTVTVSDGYKDYRVTINVEGAIYYEVI